MSIPYFSTIDHPYHRAALLRRGGKLATYLLFEKGYIPIVDQIISGKGTSKIWRVPIMDGIPDGRPRHTIPLPERPIDILFVGRMNSNNLSLPIRLPMDLQLAIKKAGYLALNEHYKCIHETLLDVLSTYGIMPDYPYSDNFLRFVNDFSHYVRSLKRDLVLRELAKLSLKFRVVAVVDAPDRLKTVYGGNIEVLGFQWWQKVIELFANSKIVVNVLPNFKYGSHERVEAAMARGSVVASDYTPEQVNRFGDDKGICLYTFNEGSLYRKLDILLNNPIHMAAMAKKGQQIVLENTSAVKCLSQIVGFSQEVMLANQIYF